MATGLPTLLLPFPFVGEGRGEGTGRVDLQGVEGLTYGPSAGVVEQGEERRIDCGIEMC